jgi:aryl-alcohol dehydrogenase-like predicted oxidoreductase
MELRPLGTTGMDVAPLSLGTVKFGRSAGLKYAAHIPTDSQARELLHVARDLGINLLDTAPAYGHSEERLGELLVGARSQWLISTKVGEEFDGERSHYDFSPEAVELSVARSLERLRTDYLDIVLIHSDGSDERILAELGTLEALQALRDKGFIRAVGISHKSVEGARAALEKGADVIMATLNRENMEDAEVVAQAAQQGCGVLIKKALASGRGTSADLAYIANQPGVHTIVIGTTSPAHLRANAAAIAAA